MRLGGVIFASLGILIVVLVANGRWASVWAAMMTPADGSSNASSSGYTGAGTGSFGSYTGPTPAPTSTSGGW